MTNVSRQFDADGIAVEQHHFDFEPSMRKRFRVADMFRGHVDLIARFLVHENVGLPFGIDVLHLALFDIGDLDGFARFVGALDDVAGDEIFQPAAREGLPFTRFTNCASRQT